MISVMDWDDKEFASVPVYAACDTDAIMMYKRDVCTSSGTFNAFCCRERERQRAQKCCGRFESGALSRSMFGMEKVARETFQTAPAWLVLQPEKNELLIEI